MHPPMHIVRKLQSIHKWVRLGWHGKEGNGGRFSLLQLYHQSDANRAMVVQRWPQDWPIYGDPYDPLVRIPMWITDYAPEHVFSGDIIASLRYNMKPMRERYEQSVDETWRDLDFKLSDLAEEAGDYLWRESRKTDHCSGNTALKFVPKEQQAIMAGDYDPRKGDIVTQPKAESAVPLR